MQTQNQCLDFLDDSSFQGVNRLFVISYEEILDIEQVTSEETMLEETLEIKDHDVMFGGNKFLIIQLK